MDNCIPATALIPGMVIVQITKQNGPHKIRKSGLVSSQAMIQGLIEMGIQEVQIDPSQTVELESPQPSHQSTTLQLLQTSSAQLYQTEGQVHEQFKRNLFLPSVQEIPSAWHFYARRYGLLLLLLAGGFGLGFSAARLPAMLSTVPALLAQTPVVQVTQSTEVLQQTDKQSVDSSATQSVTETASSADIKLEAEVQAVAVSSQQNVAREEQQQSSTQPQTQVASEASPLSAELVKRFENVIKQMDREDESQAQSANQFGEEPDSSVSAAAPGASATTQLPRIDQLPAWILTSLPGMAFSAHMYSSDPSLSWVRVNGSSMVEGDMIDGKVTIMHIAPQHVVLSFQGREFTMQAMTDW